jgi:ficolin
MSLTISDAGNDNLAALTSNTRQVLRVELGDWEGNTRYAEYDNFRVAGASSKYNMTSLGAYSGTAGQFWFIIPSVVG